MIYAILGLIFFGFFVFTSGSSTRFLPNKPLSQMIADIRDNKVEKIEIDGDRISVKLKDGQVYTSRKEENQSLFAALEAAKVDPTATAIEVRDRTFSQAWITILTTLLPLGLMVFFFFLIFRQAREGASSVFSFGQSRARQFTRDMSKITFADVAGVDEAKQELQEVVDFLKHPEKYRAVGARTPKGVLLVGPAGTGKTLLARAVAGEAGVPFFSVAGSEFMEMLVGVGAARVRDLFAQAKKTAPAIIFIDEIESIGRMRGLGFSGGHDEREQTLNQILVEMDGFAPNDNVMVMGATNRPDLLDPALTRPGRFDRRVVLDLPDIEGRKAIIKIHMKGKPFDKEVDIESLAKRTVGYSGADLANMLNEAAILAARDLRREINNLDLEEAATKVKLGPQRKRMQSEEERKMTAYHEAGHAVVAHYLPHVDPVHRISIVARGITGGHTLVPPSVDRYTETKTRLLERIATLLGGRAAEELIFDEFTTGAASDLEIASTLAREMVTEFGMSDLGPTIFAPRPQFGVWPTLMGEGGQVSPELAGKIDGEIAKIIDNGHKKAQEILQKHRAKLDLVAGTLLEKETLERDEFERLVGKPVSDGETKFKKAHLIKTARA
ncbi:cell division protein FtsH [Candidatus Curtissbacteria bacterium RIFCSPHIGHO2_01_FULL_41_44]|uniref:ATP-dependent zinc metalloprotease FtsH n=1 Tax=Candidatus Curtissbacteria bacterium RIFCSPLOWO2_01_FULL_42_50 TaxID=1797730 RepID=A0A1F5H2P1_9BACT|nr:MAG: cell division protein FtsH [Candidatus Curtissbacteria bacterium RIFCSPHIGHO2_01_FULL_41_44]OGD98432.1 MAG: cell division protein FtsH [Candidatus Curtissbacteria bacterium RIFCSPLOWO2_01_FULL_42_50]OGE11638.1 MAG: cell division protein FtsH [Candidatus Curtissbacteria bacterium RIFCSPLOWO2_02_FULL_42_37]